MRTFFLHCAAFAALALALVSPAVAGPSHFVSIRRDRAYLREGPSYAHKVLWIYQRRYYPVQVVGIFDAWRRVIDIDGTVGWMHHTQLSDVRTVLFIRRSVLRADAAPASNIVAYAQAGVVAKLMTCKPDRCEVEASDVDGWVDKKSIWGVDPSDVF